MAIEQFELELIESYKLSPNTIHCAFKRADGKPLNFIPGQFVTLQLPLEDKIKRRSFSISTIPGQSDAIEISASYVKGGIASETLFNLKPGQKLKAMGPAGRLILQEDDAIQRYILVGTGTGIAPYRAMLPSLAARFKENPQLKVEVLLGVQYRVDALYCQDFVQFAHTHSQFTFRACLSREDLSKHAEAYEHKGYVQHQFEQLALTPGNDIIYLCGNPNMIDNAFTFLTEAGFDTKSIRREKYISSN